MPQEEKKQISTTTGLLIVLAAAVIIGGGAIAYFYAASPTSWDYMGNRTSVHKSSNANTNTSNTNSTVTADWKTYTGKDFTIKYPTTYATRDASNIDKNAEYYIWFAPTVSELSDDLSFSWVSVYKSTDPTIIKNTKITTTATETNTFTVDQALATKATFAGQSSDGGRVEVFFEKNNAIYVIQIYSLQSDRLNIFDQMLSTFQFTP